MVINMLTKKESVKPRKLNETGIAIIKTSCFCLWSCV